MMYHLNSYIHLFLAVIKKQQLVFIGNLMLELKGQCLSKLRDYDRNGSFSLFALMQQEPVPKVSGVIRHFITIASSVAKFSTTKC